MQNIFNVLKQRRVWTAISAVIAFVLPLCGVNIDFDANSFVNGVMQIIEGLSVLATIILPIWSYLKPKN